MEWAKATIREKQQNFAKNHNLMDPITDDIWLGAIGAANDHKLLEKTGITSLVSLGCVPDVMPKCIKEHLKIDVEDVPSAELTPHFKTACEFIEKGLNEK